MSLDVNSSQTPFFCLIAGIFLCCIALAGAHTGKLWAQRVAELERRLGRLASQNDF
jgi:hypothetical protein